MKSNLAYVTHFLIIYTLNWKYNFYKYIQNVHCQKYFYKNTFLNRQMIAAFYVMEVGPKILVKNPNSSQ